MPPRWEEVVDQQMDTVRFWKSPFGQSYGQGYMESVIRESKKFSDGAQLEAKSMYADLATRMALMLEGAEPVWVDPDMWSLIEVAHKTFEPEPLLESDLITPAGFLVLPKSIEIVDIRGKMVGYRAFAWYPMVFNTIMPDARVATREGILLALYSDTHHKDDYFIPGQTKETPFILSHLASWIFNDSYPDDKNESGIYGIAKWVQSMWRLMSQTITVQSKERPSKHVRKRAIRAKFPEKHVTVIRLRRPRYRNKDGEESEIEWTHRFLVSGHWRQQWYSSVGEHRQIWIHPYIKGDPDLPLKVRERRVFTLVQ